jgi:hypothetical protein
MPDADTALDTMRITRAERDACSTTRSVSPSQSLAGTATASDLRRQSGCSSLGFLSPGVQRDGGALPADRHRLHER